MLFKGTVGLLCQRSIPIYPQGDPKVRKRWENPSLKDEIQFDGIFLIPFIHVACTAELQWRFYIAVLQIFTWQWLIRISGGLLAWGS